MIPRYTRPRMGRIWEDQNKYQRWLDVELAVVETLADEGVVPRDAAEEIKARASFSVDRINEIEAEVKHDVIAFTTSVSEYVGPASRYFHFGLTSSDVLDTAMALQVAEASAIILQDLERLLDCLKKRAYEFKTTVIAGRTHGVHAEPTTFGLKLALWVDELRRGNQPAAPPPDKNPAGKKYWPGGTPAQAPPQTQEDVFVQTGAGVPPLINHIAHAY